VIELESLKQNTFTSFI